MIRLTLALTAAGLAVGFANPPQATFRTGTRVVPIYATVTGADGRHLADLTADDFLVFDNGARQTIAAFSNEPAPITGMALFDVGYTMRPREMHLQRAARAFVDALWPGDRIQIVSSGAEEVAFSPWLTGDKEILRRIVGEELWVNAGAAVWHAVWAGLEALSLRTGRRVLVVFSNAQRPFDLERSKRDVLMRLQRIDAMVYALSVGGVPLSGHFKDVADASGGGYAELPREGDVDRELAAVLRELHHQYLIGFVPTVMDGAEHVLAVRTTVPGAKVRARTSYVADGRLRR